MTDLSTVVVVVAPGTPAQRVLRRSAAILSVVEELGGVWRLAAAPLRLVPARLRDFVYDLIATARHRLFGRRDACLVPDESERARFLD